MTKGTTLYYLQLKPPAPYSNSLLPTESLFLFIYPFIYLFGF